jgi:hypothetical protein
MRIDRKYFTNAGLVVLGVTAVAVFQLNTVGTVQAKAEKDCICHAAGKNKSDEPQQYICITPSVNAVTQNEQAGHLNEDATHGPEHALDFLCEDCSECGKVTPPPTPEPTPTPTPE